MEAIVHLCRSQVIKDFDIGTNNITSEFFDILKEVAPALVDTINFCKWRDHLSDCRDLFQRIITEEGVCYTFNAINSRDIYTNQ